MWWETLTLYLTNSVRVASAVDTFPDFKCDDYGTALVVFTRIHDVGLSACRDGRL